MTLRARLRRLLGPRAATPPEEPPAVARTSPLRRARNMLAGWSPIPRPARDAATVRVGVFAGAGSRLDSIVNTLSGLGTIGDKGRGGRPDVSRQALHLDELTALYRFNGYARRFVDIVPDDATRKGWKLVDDTEQQDAMLDEDKRLDVHARVADAQRWARLYGHAVILIVTDEQGRPALTEPLDPSALLRVANLAVFDAAEAIPHEWETDVRSPRFREPKSWLLYPSIGGMYGDRGISGTPVHWSRVLHFRGAKLPPSRRTFSTYGLDDSELEHAWDAIRQKTTIDQAAAVLAQDFKTDVLKVQGLGAETTGDQSAILDLRMRTIAAAKSLLNMVVLGEGDEYESRATSVTGLDALDALGKSQLAAQAGMPQVLLFGDAPGGLNTDGSAGRTNWDRATAAEQHQKLLPLLTRLYRLLYAQQQGPTGGVVPGSWRVEFEPLDEPTSKQTADLRQIVATTDVALVQAGILDPDHVLRSRYGEDGWQMELLPVEAPPEITPEEIAGMVPELPAPQPPQAPSLPAPAEG